MHIAILSDTHDHIGNLEKVVAHIRGSVDAVFHLGDWCAPFMPPLLATLNVPVYACFGNNDEDQAGMVQNGGSQFTWTPLWQEFGTAELGGKKIAFCHYPRLGELLAKTGEYDAVFHGHTHVARNEKVGETLLLNPGAVCGIQKGKYGIASYAVYDAERNVAEVIEIP